MAEESLCGIMFLGNLAGSVLYTTMQLRKMSQNLGEKIVLVSLDGAFLKVQVCVLQ